MTGPQRRATWALSLWGMNTITAEQNSMKNQENSMHVTEVCEYAIIIFYSNSICPYLTMPHKGASA